MAVTVLEAASTRRLTTLLHLEDDLGTAAVQGNSEAFERLIDRASAAVERFCGRIFAQQQYREILRAESDRLLILTHTPLVSVSSVTGDGETLTGWRIEDTHAGFLYNGSGWGVHSGVPYVSPTSAPFEWTVEYVAGYILPEQEDEPDPTGEVLPGDIEDAVLDMVKGWRRRAAEAELVRAKTFGLTGDRVEYDLSGSVGGFSTATRSILKPYRRWVVR